MLEFINMIQNRVSSPKLSEPAPTAEQLNNALACALRAPDHARLKPWRYWLIQGDARIELGHIFAKALLDEDPEASADKVTKHENMPLRSPTMVVAVCEPTDNPKVPKTEQLLSVGAGLQNLQLALTAMGYGSIWRTGTMAHSPVVRDAFEVSDEGEIVGFIYIGTPEKTGRAPELDINDYVRDWPRL